MAFLQDFFRWVIKTEFHMSIEGTWRKRVFFSGKNKFFPTNDRHWAKRFGLWSNFFRHCVKPAFYVSIETFWWREVFFWKNIYVFSSFLNLEWILLELLSEKTQWVCRNCIYPSIAFFSSNKNLNKNVFYINFCYWARNFRPSV